MATLYCFAARCLFGVVFLHKAKQGRWLCAVSAYKSLPHQRTAHESHPSWERQILKARSVSYLFPSSWALRCVLWEFFFESVWFSGQPDVRSGTSMPPCCVVNAIILYTLIHWIIQHRSRANSRLSEGRKSHVLSCNIDYPDPLTGPCSHSPRNTYSSFR